MNTIDLEKPTKFALYATVLLTIFQQVHFLSVSGAGHGILLKWMKPMNADNKAYKMSVVRPSPDYVNRIAHYLPYRTTALESLNHQLFPKESKSHTESVTSQTHDITMGYLNF